MPPEQTAPDLESETELPKYFSARRLAVLIADGASSEVGKLLLKAEARQSRGDKAGAIVALETATDSEPRLTAAHLMLAVLYEEVNDYDRAIERYRRVLAVAPKEPVSLNNLAYALAVHKNAPAEALPIAQQAYGLRVGPRRALTRSAGSITCWKARGGRKASRRRREPERPVTLRFSCTSRITLRRSDAATPLAPRLPKACNST